MKKYIIYCFMFLSLGLMIVSCEDNFDQTTTETETSEPTEVGTAPLTGRVIDSSGDPIGSAEIIIYQGDKEILFTTDGEGAYDLELPDISEKIYLQAAATDFVTSSIAKLDLSQEKYTKDFTLLQQDELLYAGEVKSLNGGLLATITGQVLLADGSPASNFNVLLLDFNQILSSPSDFVFTYVDTDADGFYSITHEPFENYMLLVHDDCISQSNFEFISQQLSLEDMDIDLGVYQSDLTALGKITLSGFISDCNTNSGLDRGLVHVDLGSGNRVSAEIIDGVYSLEFANCDDLNCVPVTITSEGAHVGYSKFDCFPIPNMSNTLDHTLCGDDRIQEGEIRLLVGSDSIIFMNAFAGDAWTGTASEGLWIGSLDLNNLSEYFIVEHEGNEIGTFPVDKLELAQNFEIIFSAYSNGSNSLVEITIDKIDNRIEGSIAGLVENRDGDLVPISGTYSIEI